MQISMYMCIYFTNDITLNTVYILPFFLHLMYILELFHMEHTNLPIQV